MLLTVGIFLLLLLFLLFQLLTSENRSLSVLTSDNEAGQTGPVSYKTVKERTVGGTNQNGRLFGRGLLTNDAHIVTAKPEAKSRNGCEQLR